MKLEQVQSQIDAALATSDADDKLAAIECAVIFDTEHAGQEMGKFAVHSLLEQYEQNTDETVRSEETSQQGRGIMFTSAHTAYVYATVANALGSYYGVTISKPDTEDEYLRAAMKVRNAIASHYPPHRPDTMFEFHEDVQGTAESALKREDYLLEIDYSVPGTAYFMDAVRVVTKNNN